MAVLQPILPSFSVRPLKISLLLHHLHLRWEADVEPVQFKASIIIDIFGSTFLKPTCPNFDGTVLHLNHHLLLFLFVF